MSKALKQAVETETANTIKWEALKSQGLEVELATAHQPVPFFTHTERTLSQSKLNGVKLWWTSAGLLGEFRGKRELIPTAAIARVMVKL